MDKPRLKRRCVQRSKPHIDHEDESDFSDHSETPLESYKDTLETKNTFESIIVRLTMQNTTVMFRKIVNHPYLVHFPLDPKEESKCLLVNEDLINTSGKMMVLDLLLHKLKENGHKVIKGIKFYCPV